MDIHSASLDRLFESILKLESVEECYRFFEDLCTVKEIEDMGQRLDVAVLLSEGVSYQKISEKVKVSSATAPVLPQSQSAITQSPGRSA